MSERECAGAAGWRVLADGCDPERRREGADEVKSTIAVPVDLLSTARAGSQDGTWCRSGTPGASASRHRGRLHEDAPRRGCPFSRSLRLQLSTPWDAGSFPVARVDHEGGEKGGSESRSPEEPSARRRSKLGRGVRRVISRRKSRSRASMPNKTTRCGRLGGAMAGAPSSRIARATGGTIGRARPRERRADDRARRREGATQKAGGRISWSRRAGEAEPLFTPGASPPSGYPHERQRLSEPARKAGSRPPTAPPIPRGHRQQRRYGTPGGPTGRPWRRSGRPARSEAAQKARWCPRAPTQRARRRVLA